MNNPIPAPVVLGPIRDRLATVENDKANAADLATLGETVAPLSGRLDAVEAGKANAAALDALAGVVAGKAAAADVATLTGRVGAVESDKADRAKFGDTTGTQPDLVPLVVDEAGNVPLWLVDGLIGALGLSPELLSTIRVEKSPDTWPPFVVYSEGDQRVLLIADERGATFYGTSLTTTIEQPPAPAVTIAPLSTDGRSLYAWRARLAAALGGNGIAKVILTGDSWTEHRAETALPLSQALFAKYGQSGLGWVSVRADESGMLSQLLNGTLVKSAGWSLHDMTVAAHALDGFAVYATGTAATITISNLKTQSLRWYYLDSNGTFRYSVDGGAPVTVIGGNTGARKSITISGLSDAEHNIVFDLVGNTGTVTMYGGYATRSASGVEFSKAGNGGSTAEQWSGLASIIQAYAAEILPDVAIVILGTNDSRFGATKATYKAGIQTLVNAYRAGAPNCAVVLVAPAAHGSSGIAVLPEYRDALFEIASTTAGVEVLNLYAAMPGYATTNGYGLWLDALHLNENGGRFVTGLITKHLLETN